MKRSSQCVIKFRLFYFPISLFYFFISYYELAGYKLSGTSLTLFHEFITTLEWSRVPWKAECTSGRAWSAGWGLFPRSRDALNLAKWELFLALSDRSPNNVFMKSLLPRIQGCKCWRGHAVVSFYQQRKYTCRTFSAVTHSFSVCGNKKRRVGRVELWVLFSQWNESRHGIQSNWDCTCAN